MPVAPILPIKSNSSIWILSPVKDSVFFVFTPLLIIPIFAWLKLHWTVEQLSIWIFSVGALGHHVPGMLRAYGDPELLKRYKFRLTVVPVFLLVICTLYAWLDLNALVFIVVMWGMWHGAMQINGFIRIYDAKVKCFDSVTAWLDWSMCIAWFILAVVYSPAKQVSIYGHFYGSGGHIIPAYLILGAKPFLTYITAIITIAFFANYLRLLKIGLKPNPIKIPAMLSAFAFWWFSMVSINNLLFGIILWEVFHDIQYNALVWVYNRNRVKHNLHISRIEKFIFEPAALKVFFYLLIIFAYGYIGVISDYMNINSPESMLDKTNWTRILTKVVLVSAFFHFYLDGFIWRVREKSFREGLGLSGQNDSKKPSLEKDVKRPPSKIVSLLKWSLFFIPVLYLGFMEYKGYVADDRSQYQNLAKAIPDSWYTNFIWASLEKIKGHVNEAIHYYELAIINKPDFYQARLFLADLLYQKNSIEKARFQYEQVLKYSPKNALAQHNLGMIYAEQKNYPLAMTHLSLALQIEADNLEWKYNLAEVYLKAGHINDAQIHLAQILENDPNHVPSLNYLGVIAEFKNNLSLAKLYYEKALSIDPNAAGPIQNMNSLKTKLDL